MLSSPTKFSVQSVPQCVEKDILVLKLLQTLRTPLDLAISNFTKKFLLLFFHGCIDDVWAKHAIALSPIPWFYLYLFYRTAQNNVFHNNYATHFSKKDVLNSISTLNYKRLSLSISDYITLPYINVLNLEFGKM